MSFFLGGGGCEGTFRGTRQFLLSACGADTQFRISLHVFAADISCLTVFFYLISRYPQDISLENMARPSTARQMASHKENLFDAEHFETHFVSYKLRK
jgi:hypothetical protein